VRAMASEAAPSAGDLQVQVRFETRLPELYRVPGTTFAVPASLNRYGLSEVVNTLLGISGTACLRRCCGFGSRDPPFCLTLSSALFSAAIRVVASHVLRSLPLCHPFALPPTVSWSLQSDPSHSTFLSKASSCARLCTSACWPMASPR